MTAPRRLAACLVVCGLALGAASAAPAQREQPSPRELWEMYPLNPTEGERERPAATTPTTTVPASPSPPPRRGVAGEVTRSPSRSAAPGDSDDTGALARAVLLGGLAAAIVLLSAALVPSTPAPRLIGRLAHYRLEIALAGAFVLVAVAVLYISTVT